MPEGLGISEDLLNMSGTLIGGSDALHTRGPECPTFCTFFPSTASVRILFFPRSRLWSVFYSDMALLLIGETGNGKITRVP